MPVLCSEAEDEAEDDVMLMDGIKVCVATLRPTAGRTKQHRTVKRGPNHKPMMLSDRERFDIKMLFEDKHAITDSKMV